MAKPNGSCSEMVRIDARIPLHIKEIVMRAASIQGQSQTDFMISALHVAAQKVIADNAVIRLCLADQKILAESLLAERTPAAAGKLSRLRHASREHAKRVMSK